MDTPWLPLEEQIVLDFILSDNNKTDFCKAANISRPTLNKYLCEFTKPLFQRLKQSYEMEIYRLEKMQQ